MMIMAIEKSLELLNAYCDSNWVFGVWSWGFNENTFLTVKFNGLVLGKQATKFLNGKLMHMKRGARRQASSLSKRGREN